jgi:hypothetical protein
VIACQRSCIPARTPGRDLWERVTAGVPRPGSVAQIEGVGGVVDEVDALVARRDGGGEQSPRRLRASPRSPLFPTGRFFADSTTTRLSFEIIEIDRSFLSDTLAQLPAIVDAFPVRGDITAD